MKTHKALLILLSFVLGLGLTSSGQCTVTLTNNVLLSKPNYYYFGQVWHGEVFINPTSQDLLNFMGSSSTVRYSLRHSETGDF
ncbi:MAG: hypothetical protein JNM68_08205, partial [Dinghuibacter sp.]|nr:hypothetical protein [Dinghuibacter sp.]